MFINAQPADPHSSLLTHLALVSLNISLSSLQQWPPPPPSPPPPPPTPDPDSPSGSGARRSPLSTARLLPPPLRRHCSTATLTSMSRRTPSESLTTVNSRRASRTHFWHEICVLMFILCAPQCRLQDCPSQHLAWRPRRCAHYRFEGAPRIYVSDSSFFTFQASYRYHIHLFRAPSDHAKIPPSPKFLPLFPRFHPSHLPFSHHPY